jgi:hypothetical protein
MRRVVDRWPGLPFGKYYVLQKTEAPSFFIPAVERLRATNSAIIGVSGNGYFVIDIETSKWYVFPVDQKDSWLQIVAVMSLSESQLSVPNEAGDVWVRGKSHPSICELIPRGYTSSEVANAISLSCRGQSPPSDICDIVSSPFTINPVNHFGDTFNYSRISEKEFEVRDRTTNDWVKQSCD